MIGVIVPDEEGNTDPTESVVPIAREAIIDVHRRVNFDWIDIATFDEVDGFLRACRRCTTPEGFLVEEPHVEYSREAPAVFPVNSDTGRAIVDELLARTNAHVSRWLRDVRHAVVNKSAEEIFEDPTASWRVRSLNFEGVGTFLYRWAGGPYGVYSRRSLTDALETRDGDELYLVLAIAKS